MYWLFMLIYAIFSHRPTQSELTEGIENRKKWMFFLRVVENAISLQAILVKGNIC